MDHPLDHPVWTALTTRQESLARIEGGIRRYRPEFGPFAASADGTAVSLAGLASLVPEGSQVYLAQREVIDPPPGLRVLRVAKAVQMIVARIIGPSDEFPCDVLTSDNAPEMLALAQLTRPGPFAERTHELGCFLGIRHEGRLVAMAGERMKPGPFTEISGVCTHPDHRGKGYAAGLTREVGRAILARGETPFLHAFSDNANAIALYGRLGFTMRWEPLLIALARV